MTAGCGTDTAEGLTPEHVPKRRLRTADGDGTVHVSWPPPAAGSVLYRVGRRSPDEEGGEVPYRKAAIRPYQDADEPLLFGLARMTFGERAGWSDSRTLAVLETESVFVAEIAGAVAGYVALEPSEPAVRIDVLLVSPEHEGEGIGHQLVEWAEGYAISRGARTLQVAVENDNAKAVDFYRRRGFVPAAGGLLELVLPQS